MPFDKMPLSAGGKRHNPAGSDISKRRGAKWRGICASVAAAVLLAGCATQNNAQLQPAGLAAPKKNLSGTKSKNKRANKAYAQQAAFSGRLTERRCLERAMFFESNRSSRDGLVAVGTVVMNRVHSSQYPSTICSVVGQRNQFAPGVLTRPVNIAALPDVAAAADAVLRGERSPKLKNAMYFHTAGLRFPYNNMHYVLVAGGNSFYERRSRDGRLSNPVHDETYDVAYAFAQDQGETAAASAALDGAVSGATDNIKLASISRSPRGQILQTAYRPVIRHNEAAAAANASLSTVYDERRKRADERSPAEQSRVNEARAEMVSYTPDSVPVPQMKAVYHSESGKGGQEAPAYGGPHFMRLSAPQAGGAETGFLRETEGLREVSGDKAAKQTASVSYKAPDAEKAGEVGAQLLSGKP